MDMDYSQPTWSAAPWVVLDTISLMLRQPSPMDPAATARTMRLKYAETEHAFLCEVPEGLRFFFRELIRLVRAYTTLDDLEHYQTTRINPLARLAALALGRRLAEVGILDEPADVFFFRLDDVTRLMADFPPAGKTPFRDKLYEAKRSYQAAWTATPLWSLAEPAAGSTLAPAAGTLRGFPGSPGKVSAPCCLVRSPVNFARFPPGAVLVARTTNPAWTPLFYSAVGPGDGKRRSVVARRGHRARVASARGDVGAGNHGAGARRPTIDRRWHARVGAA